MVKQRAVLFPVAAVPLLLQLQPLLLPLPVVVVTGIMSVNTPICLRSTTHQVVDKKLGIGAKHTTTLGGEQKVAPSLRVALAVVVEVAVQQTFLSWIHYVNNLNLP